MIEIGVSEQEGEVVQPHPSQWLIVKHVMALHIPIGERHAEARDQREQREREKPDDVRREEKEADPHLAAADRTHAHASSSGSGGASQPWCS